MIKTTYQGMIYIQAWEFVLIPVFLFIIFLIASRIKNRRIKEESCYRYYLIALYAKIFGGLVFAFVYIYGYQGGDTMAYYETILAMLNMLMKDPGIYIETLLGPVSKETFLKYDLTTGYLLNFAYYDAKTFMVSRITSLLAIVCFRSYLLTTIVVSWVTFSGLWRLYLMFVRYYPMLHFRLAIAVLFVPSIIFWGSGIMKDSYTMAATGWFVYYIDYVFIRRNISIRSIIQCGISAAILILIKPYIFMLLFPGTFYWILSFRARRIKNKLAMYLFLPVGFTLVTMICFYVLDSLGSVLGKFSLENALKTAAMTSQDLRSERYQGSSFNIGVFEPTLQGALSKFVPATIAGLFRPFLWEARNLGTFISGIENFIILFFALITIGKTRVIGWLSIALQNPLIMFCLMFAISFGFVIGLSTSNFGALVRFRIPILPFLISAFVISYYLAGNKRHDRV